VPGEKRCTLTRDRTTGGARGGLARPPSAGLGLEAAKARRALVLATAKSLGPAGAQSLLGLCSVDWDAQCTGTVSQSNSLTESNLAQAMAAPRERSPSSSSPLRARACCSPLALVAPPVVPPATADAARPHRHFSFNLARLCRTVVVLVVARELRRAVSGQHPRPRRPRPVAHLARLDPRRTAPALQGPQPARPPTVPRRRHGGHERRLPPAE